MLCRRLRCSLRYVEKVSGVARKTWHIACETGNGVYGNKVVGVMALLRKTIRSHDAGQRLHDRKSIAHNQSCSHSCTHFCAKADALNHEISARCRFAIAGLFVIAMSVSAAMFSHGAFAAVTESALEALIETNQGDQVERITRERIAKNPKDEMAYRYLALSALVQNDSKKRSAALDAMDACIALLPQSSQCHLQAGRLLGINAMEAGMLSAMGSVGRIKDYFLKALEYDPKSFEARRDLMQFYLQAPGIAGGSVAKAREIAQAAAAYNIEHSKLLRASVAMYEKKRDEAEQLLQSVAIGSDESLVEHLENGWISLGFSHISAKAAAKAKSIFERMVKDNPKRANAYFYLGRAQLEMSDWDAAIGSFKTAAQLDKSATYATDYRLGIAYQGKGDKAQARAAYERALKWPRINDSARSDVQKRIDELG
jgi:tetratricopeptide (TPR) repeat protein